MRSSLQRFKAKHRPSRPTPATLRARSGSALVVVIGTLALISVFAAIYISIGRSDTRAVATQEIRAEQSDYADRYLEHAIGIVGIDRLDATMQYADADLRYQVPRRETTDAPYTDWSVRSQSDDPADWFFPAGGNPFTRRSGDSFDPRVPSDPWLASLRPEFLGDPLDRPFSENATQFELEGFLDKRDWLQISNMAPDGRFVNLFNLRPNPFPPAGGGPIGGFNAEPGWGSTNSGTGPAIRRMSEGLSLYRPLNVGDVESPIQSYDPRGAGFWVPGLSAAAGPVDLGLSAQEIENTPAVWSMYQRFALIPLDQPFVTYNRLGTGSEFVSTWADPDFPAYQWGDADGDGFADSRWFELTIAREDVSGSNPREDAQRLYDAGEFRVFAAARAVDLSGMVNANIARDSLGAPTAEHPLGLTPVEIDLRRLLTMQDQAESYDGDVDPSNRDEPLSFAHLRRPAVENGVGADASLLSDADYSRYRHFTEGVSLLDLDPGVSFGPNPFPGSATPTQREFPNAMLIGRYAASAIHESVVRGVTLPQNARGPLPFDSGTAAPPDLLDSELLLTEGSLLTSYSNTGTDPNELGEDRFDYYDRIARFDPTRQDERQVSSLFGIDDLSELLTFHGLNDPELTSRLESAAQGRFQFAGGTGDERYSPLLSTRPLSLDRDLHGQVLVLASNPNRGTEVSGEISRESMALMTLSPRTKLTTVSGAVPLPPAGVAGIAGRNSSELAPSGLLNGLNQAVSLADFGTNAGSAFRVYSGALAGELEVLRLKRAAGVDGLPAGIVNAVWEQDLIDVRDNPYSTLFYGHRGPELALRVAAHAAVNARDLFDSDNETTIATLVLDNDASTVRTPLDRFRQYVGSTPSFDLDTPRGSLALLYPGLIGSSSALFDVDAGLDNAADRPRRVLPEGQLPDGRRLVNVYGVEATPIITHAASMFVYTDAPSSVSGDGGDFGGRPRPGRFPVPGSIEQITIDRSLDASNADLLMQVLAVQITNPWDVAINIGGGSGPGGLMWRKSFDTSDPNQPADPNSNLEFNYYIEYNGRFFKLGGFRDYVRSVAEGSVDYADNDDYVAAGLPPVTAAGIDLIANPQPELEYESVILRPGESRVFYATAHVNLRDLDARWEDILTANGNVLPESYVLPIGTTGIDHDRDDDGLLDGLDGRDWTGLAQDWLTSQLSIRQSGRTLFPSRIHPFDPTTGELVEGLGPTLPSGYVNLTGDAGDPANDLGFTSRLADPGVVRLWKKHVVNGVEEVPNAERTGSQITENLIQNDILVDRLYLADPGSEAGVNYLHAALDSSVGDEVPNTVSFDETFVPQLTCSPAQDSINVRNDNLGLTLTRWSSVRRKDTMNELNSGDSNPEANVGKIDAYLIASRRTPLDTITRSTNAAGLPDQAALAEVIPDAFTAEDMFDLCEPTDPVRWDSSSRGVQPSREHDVYLTPQDFFARASGGAFGRRPIPTIARHPRQNNPLSAAANLIEGDRFPIEELDRVVGDLDLFEAPGTDSLRPEIFLSRPLNTGRVADTLRAMGIGPAYAPDLNSNPRANPATDFAVYDDEWMTLSEAFAIALGFEDFVGIITATDVSPDAVWFDSVRSYTDPASGASEVEYVLDDLRLRLDDYVAFINRERTTVDETEKAFFSFNPLAPGVSDARRGTGVPMALGVLDSVRAFEPAEYPSNRIDTSVADSELTQALTTPTMGLVNINTAPLDVLRLLPGLSPSAQGYRERDVEASTSSPAVEWWAGGVNPNRSVTPGLFEDAALGLGANYLDWPGTGIPAEAAANSPDIAAGLAAYRDRTFATPRVRSDPRFFGAGTLPLPFGYVIDTALDPTLAEAVIDNRYGESDLAQFATRAAIANVDGLRGTPGFGSLGEMLMASIRDDAATLPAPGDRLASYPHLSMQQLASDQRNLGVTGSGVDAVSLSPNFAGTGSSLPDGNRAGNTPDDYVEKLAAAAGVMNMTTTRSDFYAVWMVIQGFRESDVDSLRPSDPLVPSFKRRFLMVLDRSNVLEPGDTPRVLLMREVPL